MNAIPNLGRVYRYNDESISFRLNFTKEIIEWLQNSKDIYFKN